jgi:hypothetical protein
MRKLTYALEITIAVTQTNIKEVYKNYYFFKCFRNKKMLLNVIVVDSIEDINENTILAMSQVMICINLKR